MSKNTNLSFLTDFITADIVNSRVGINNASPQTTFDVTGTGKFSGILTLGSTISNGTYAYTLPSATGTLALTSQIPANAVGGTGTINTIPKFTAASTIGNSNIFDSGSIIYNTNPTAGQFAWQFGGSTTTGQSYGAQVLAGTNSSDTAFRVLNASASSTYLLVRGDGNVGIGTTLPSAGLEIETDGSAKTALRVTSNQAFNASPVTAIMFRYRISSGTTIGGAVINAAKDNATENNQAGNLQFWTNNGSTLAERMQISSGGNVGIGVTPSVWGSAFKAIQILNQASISAEADLIASSVNAFYDTSWKYIANGVATNYYQNNGQHVWRNATSGTAGNAITWSVPMTLTSGGNLLVGTTTDNGARLQVSGTATTMATITSSATASGLQLTNSGGTASSWVIQSDGGAVAGQAALRFYSLTASAYRMSIDGSGNVGIGTASPGAWGGNYVGLQISSTGAFASNGTNGTVIGHNFYYDGTNDKYLTTGAASRVFQFLGGIRFDLASSGSAGNNITFTQAMTLTSGGNVLIGTTTDNGSKLRVSGNIQIDGFQKMYTYYIIVQPNTTGTITISSPTGTNMQGSMQVMAGGYGNSLSGNITGLWMVGGLLFFNNASTSTITQIVNSVTANGSMSFQRSSDQYTVTLANTSSLYTKTLFVSVIINGD